jgi:crotonobetainyl-CoA:carnitine CoA-transferase CaiB-like acyl-CoA transferase
MAGVLEGLRVLEMGHVVAAPAAGATLADWGAEVIKIEPLSGEMARGFGHPITPEEIAWTKSPDYVNGYFQFLNRGKKGLALDLRTASGQEIMSKLVAWADVFFTNYEAGTLAKLGVDYPALRTVNPRLVYGVLTGYGTVGPDKDERGFDYSAAWARCGLMHLMGEPGSIPPPQRGGMMDRVAGAHLVGGLLAAVYRRNVSGQGQKVELSLYQTGVWTAAEDIQAALLGREPQRHDRAMARNPLWNNYRAGDGEWFWAAMLQPDLSWGDFCRALAHPEWENDPRFDTVETRFWNREELIRLIDEVLSTKPMAEWEVIFRANNVIYGRVRSPREVVDDPQALANDFFVSLRYPDKPNVKTVMTPVKFVESPAEVSCPAPEVGQHTEEVLLALGYDWNDIARLKEEQAIL